MCGNLVLAPVFFSVKHDANEKNILDDFVFAAFFSSFLHDSSENWNAEIK